MLPLSVVSIPILHLVGPQCVSLLPTGSSDLCLIFFCQRWRSCPPVATSCVAYSIRDHLEVTWKMEQGVTTLSSLCKSGDPSHTAGTLPVGGSLTHCWAPHTWPSHRNQMPWHTPNAGNHRTTPLPPQWRWLHNSAYLPSLHSTQTPAGLPDHAAWEHTSGAVSTPPLTPLPFTHLCCTPHPC